MHVMVVWLAFLIACGDTAEERPGRPGPVEAPSIDARRQVEKLQRELEALDRKVNDAIELVVAAQNENDRANAKNKLEVLRYEKKKLLDKLAELKWRRSANDVVETVGRLERELAALDAKIAPATDAMVAAQTDNDRSLARSKLAPLLREKAELEARLAAAKETAAQGRKARLPRECADNPLAKGCT